MDINITILVDCFATVIPLRVTAVGKLAVAWFTRFCTKMVAMSISVPTSKVMVSLYVPELDDVEDIYNAPSTPFTAVSIGTPTVSAMVSALAPG